MVEFDTKHDKITPTADLISYYRIFSDTPYTKEIAKITNAEKVAKGILKENLDSSSFLAVMSESRYKKIDIYAKKFKNILEVAIGRSPRDLIFTENPEVNFIATDLPDSLANHKLIIKELMKKHKITRLNLQFKSVNALNFKELKSAEGLLPKGEAAIISEGMMVYFSRDEKRAFLENVHKILEKRGGVLITSDIMVLNRNINRSPQIHESIAKTSGRDMRDCNFDDEDDAKRFISECSFDFELFNPEVELVSVKKLNLENEPRAQRFVKMPVWILKIK